MTEVQRPVEGTAALLEKYDFLQRDRVIAPILRLLKVDFVQPEQHIEEISWFLALTTVGLDIYRYRRLRKKLAEKVGIETDLAELCINAIRDIQLNRKLRPFRAYSPNPDKAPKEK